MTRNDNGAYRPKARLGLVGMQKRPYAPWRHTGEFVR